MNTILLRLVAPMQSWGTQSNFSIRDSGLEPSKSGVIGLICAALGRPRDASLEDLSRLRMGIRVDREGILRSDYQIAQNVLDSAGEKTKDSVPSTRYYLADAAFLVGLEGSDITLFEQIQQAMQAPAWALFLGRKAFPPSFPVWLPDGIRKDTSLEDALAVYPRIVAGVQGSFKRKPVIEKTEDSEPIENYRDQQEKLRFIIERADGEQIRSDVPISFAKRIFSSRRVKTLAKFVPYVFVQEVEDVFVQTAA